MKAKIFGKGEKTQIVLEAEDQEEKQQVERIWELREKIRVVSVCRIEAPSPPGIFLSLKAGE